MPPKGSKGTKHLKSAESIEKAKTLYEMGWTMVKISKEFGVTEATISRWLSQPDPPEYAESLEKFRAEHRERYVKEAWDIIFMSNQICIDKIKEGPGAFKSPKDAAIVQAIYIDKIAAIEARRGGGKPASPVNIMILPPQDGLSARVITDPISVSDIDGEVLCDDSRSRLGENLLRLSEGDTGSLEQSGEPRDDSGFDLQEP